MTLGSEVGAFGYASPSIGQNSGLGDYWTEVTGPDSSSSGTSSALKFSMDDRKHGIRRYSEEAAPRAFAGVENDAS